MIPEPRGSSRGNPLHPPGPDTLSTEPLPESSQPQAARWVGRCHVYVLKGLIPPFLLESFRWNRVALSVCRNPHGKLATSLSLRRLLAIQTSLIDISPQKSSESTVCWVDVLDPGSFCSRAVMATDDAAFNRDDYNGDSLLATAAVFLALSWFSVILRTYTRAILTKSFMLDDWFILGSQVSLELLLGRSSTLTSPVPDCLHDVMRLHSQGSHGWYGEAQQGYREHG